MGVRLGDVRTAFLPSTLSRRRATEQSLPRTFRRGLTRVLAADRVARWEWLIAISAVFFLSRGPALFFRRRLASVFGPVSPIWQEDLVIQLFLAVLCVLVLGATLLRASPSVLVRQPFLLAFVALAWLSIAWSVEPGVSFRRTLFLMGTIAVGAYVGDRLSLSQQVRLAASVALIGMLLTILSLFIWTELAVATGGTRARWSGVYVNRNWLGLVLAFGLLALVFLARPARRRMLLWFAAAVMGPLLLLTRSKTGPAALAAALVVTAWVWLLRRLGGRSRGPDSAALFVLSTLGSIGMLIHWYWSDILVALNRDPTMTGRTAIWQVVRWFSSQHPWFGFGYEAIWTHPPSIAKARLAIGEHPYAAHNGYYEIMLSVGRIGLLLFIGFLLIAAWRAFRFAWHRTDLMSLWPLAFIVFAAVANFSEGTFIANDAILTLVVAIAVGTTRWPRRQHAEDHPPPVG